MCFSAGASFAAGAVITAAGVAVTTKVSKPSQRLFACLPFLFAIQQVTEGFIWLALQNPDYAVLEKINTYIFLIVADVLWPVMIPLSVILLEENGKKRKIIRIFLYAGIFLSLYYSTCLMLFRINPEIINCHIYYAGAFPQKLMLPAFLLYITVTVTPLFISTVKRMYILGILMFAGCVVSVIFYTRNVTSVWCFFAAIISVVIYWILKGAEAQRQRGNDLS
ncbi:MAG: hypothetical protein NT092_13670 [Bacteroidia bacterium]|nr:hypothetical protein [Bacteroidia bacterium]